MKALSDNAEDGKSQEGQLFSLLDYSEVLQGCRIAQVERELGRSLVQSPVHSR